MKNNFQKIVFLFLIFSLFSIAPFEFLLTWQPSNQKSLSYRLAQAKKKNPKPAPRAIKHNNAGVTALYQGDTDRALFEFKTATELSPTYEEAWNNLGLAYKSKGQLELGIQALKTAISLNRKYASPYNHLGTIYYNLGRYDEALTQLKKATKYNKKFSDAYYNMGITYVAMAHRSGNNKKQLSDAINALVKATTINAEHPYAHNELAKVYQTLEEYEKAIIRYKLALEINPQLTESWISLATLYNQTGETLKAQQALNRAMAQDPNSPAVHMNLGLSYLNEKNYLLAIREFDFVIEKMPTNEMAYFNAAYAHFQMGVDEKNKGLVSKAETQFNQAIRAYQSALNLKPNFTDAAFNIAFTYQTMNDVPNSLLWYQKTLTINPNYARALYALGELYQGQGDTKNAATHFCRLLRLSAIDINVDIVRLKSQVKEWGGCK